MLQGCVRGVRPANYHQLSQEFQLASNGNDSIEWLAGATYFEGDQSRFSYTIIPVRNPLPITNAFSTSDEQAYAVFGQATLHFAERWGITGGLRFSNEKQRTSSIGTGVGDNTTLATAENAWDGTSWRIDLRYAASDELLLYAGVSTGFKSGGVTTTRLPDGDFNRFDAEDLTAYEAGVKLQSRDRRLTLNGATFFYDFRNLQVGSVYLFESRVISEIDNAASAEVYGIDLAGTFQVSNQVSISAGGVWLPEREFVDYTNERTGDTLSGKKLSRAPELSAMAAVSYTHAVRNVGSFSARLEYNYRSGFYFTKENDPDFSQHSFGLLNLLLNFETGSEKWYVFAAGRNLTNSGYFNQVFLQASPGYPDTYEAGFGYRF